jgi:DNA polymerase-1
MLLQVHDELVFDAHNSELEKIQPMIKHEMENAFKLDVPLTVELGMGKMARSRKYSVISSSCGS